MFAHVRRTLSTHKPKDCHVYIQKTWSWLLPVPRTEALRLPNLSERATLRPHADMYKTPQTDAFHRITHGEREFGGCVKYIPMGIYRCIAQ